MGRGGVDDGGEEVVVSAWSGRGRLVLASHGGGR